MSSFEKKIITNRAHVTFFIAAAVICSNCGFCTSQQQHWWCRCLLATRFLGLFISPFVFSWCCCCFEIGIPIWWPHWTNTTFGVKLCCDHGWHFMLILLWWVGEIIKFHDFIICLWMHISLTGWRWWWLLIITPSFSVLSIFCWCCCCCLPFPSFCCWWLCSCWWCCSWWVVA